MHDNKLSKKEIDFLRNQARQRLLAYCKLNDVLGAQVFGILEKESKVLYYPLEDRQVWGFSEKIDGKSFVCINSSLEYDKQVFAAAHDLYHIWFDSPGEVMLSDNLQEIKSDMQIEVYANRFAAEFLIEEQLLHQEIHVYGMDNEKIELKDIIRLANHFVVPYRTMVKRLYEVKILREKEYLFYLNISHEQVEIWKKRLGLQELERKVKIGLSDLVDRAVDLYEKNLITYDKLEYLLSLSELTPDMVGIDAPVKYVPPTDEELDAIMEE